eukprot:136264-Prymnesium_polylepis.1
MTELALDPTALAAPYLSGVPSQSVDAAVDRMAYSVTPGNLSPGLPQVASRSSQQVARRLPGCQ